MADKSEQIDKFKDAARKLETDESEQHFDEKLKRVAKAKKIAEASDKKR